MTYLVLPTVLAAQRRGQRRGTNRQAGNPRTTVMEGDWVTIEVRCDQPIVLGHGQRGRHIPFVEPGVVDIRMHPSTWQFIDLGSDLTEITEP